MLRCAAIAAGLMLGLLSAARAQPARIIILRHGEKQNDFRLCDIGVRRSLALTSQFLGRGADASLFPPDAPPAAFLATTLHTIELAAPAAASWGLPLVTYAAVPSPRQDRASFTTALDNATRAAANRVLADPRLRGRTVVMVWEHHHIADASLAKRGEVTLRQSLHLDRLPGVPASWSGDNYDWFWIVDYESPGSPVPTQFRMVRQSFVAPYADLPADVWGEPEKLPASTGCER